MGYESFSDFAINHESGACGFYPVEGLEGSTILHTLLEQLRYEKGNVGACPIRIWYEGDKDGLENILFEECIGEESRTPLKLQTYQDHLL